jgi:hypothetical protein
VSLLTKPRSDFRIREHERASITSLCQPHTTTKERWSWGGGREETVGVNARLDGRISSEPGSTPSGSNVGTRHPPAAARAIGASF